MRPVTVVVLVSLVVGLGAVGFVALGGDGVALEERWISDTGRDVRANHHAVAAGTVDGQGYVFAPVSARSGTDGCGLYALASDTGDEAWHYRVPPANCTIHSVADPTLADVNGDGRPEVVAATTEQRAVAFDPTSGELLRSYELSAYGYSKPLVADLNDDGEPEVIVVDVLGTVSVFEPDGEPLWTHPLGAYTWGQPVVAEVDGEPALFVASGGPGGLYRFTPDGEVAWNRSAPFDGAITWSTSVVVDGTPLVVAASDGGSVVAVEPDGEVAWRVEMGRFPAVHAAGDGDGDGEPEVYAVDREGRLLALDAATGETEWETSLTAEPLQMAPPPALGDVTGDGEPELVTVTHAGTVALIDPEDGSTLATYERDVQVYTHPTLADADGDGAAEVFVIYADGRVVSLEANE